MIPRDAARWSTAAALCAGAAYVAGVSVPATVGAYVVMDRVLARHHTGSWLGFPSDLDAADEERELVVER